MPSNTERDLEIVWRYQRGDRPILIARYLGISRNIVAGVISRAKSSGRLELQTEAPPSEAGVHLLDVKKNDCRWPIAPMRFCGAPKVEGASPYCDDHTQAAYTQYVRKA